MSRVHPRSWGVERERYPNWPSSKFRITDTKEHNGVVYYVRKGDFIAIGTTALVERLPSGGGIVKTPLQNLHNPVEERMNRESMVREAEIYRLMMGDDENPAVPKLLGWDAQSCTLTLGYQCNGDFATYIKKAGGTVNIDWLRQAAQALATLHGKLVVHADVAPRNFLLNGSLDLCI